jgi:hypothetical protein
MSRELFRRIPRTGFVAAVMLALVPVTGALAAAATSAPKKAASATAPKAKPNAARAGAGKSGATKAGATKAGGAKAKSAKAKKAVAAPAPAPEPVLSEAASRVLAWITLERDNGSLPYIVIDKQAGSMLMFNAAGELQGQVPVLIGVGVGDDSSPGVGAKSLSQIGPAERTTPAGRFASKFGKAFGNQVVLWVDYANSVAIHAVITTNKKERRVQRLLSPEPDDNRVTFGCINVGTSFYTNKVRPLFRKKGGVVYILPDTKPLEDVFPRVRLLPYLNEAAS